MAEFKKKVEFKIKTKNFKTGVKNSCPVFEIYSSGEI